MKINMDFMDGMNLTTRYLEQSAMRLKINSFTYLHTKNTYFP